MGTGKTLTGLRRIGYDTTLKQLTPVIGEYRCLRRIGYDTTLKLDALHDPLVNRLRRIGYDTTLKLVFRQV